jgi:hypothetical protein
MARLKGSSIGNTIGMARELLGEERLAALVAPLPDATRALFARRVLPVEWVPLDDWLPFHVALLERHFAGDEEPYREFIRRSCERSFSTLYRVFIKLLFNPEQLVGRAAAMWSTLMDTGELRIVSREKQGERTRMVLRIDHIPVSHAVWGVIIHGFVEQLVAMAGGRDIVIIRPVNHLAEDGIEWELHCSFKS